MSSNLKIIQWLYQSFVGIANKLQSPLLLIVRLYWGYQFYSTGKGKLSDLGKVTEFFTTLGIPFPAVNAAMAGTTECVGGLLLLLGLCSRPASLALCFTMIVAYVTADLEAVKSIFSENPEKFLAADPFQFLFAALLVLAFGPGYFSIDNLLGRFFPPQLSSDVKK